MWALLVMGCCYYNGTTSTHFVRSLQFSVLLFHIFAQGLHQVFPLVILTLGIFQLRFLSEDKKKTTTKSIKSLNLVMLEVQQHHIHTPEQLELSAIYLSLYFVQFVPDGLHPVRPGLDLLPEPLDLITLRVQILTAEAIDSKWRKKTLFATKISQIQLFFL